MPTGQIFKIDPLDLQKNKAIGVSIPFNGKGVFNKTYETKTQLRSNLFNLILTNQGERLFNPLFGSDLRRYLFDNLTDSVIEKINNNILESVSLYIPQIVISEIKIEADQDNHKLEIFIKYNLKISGVEDSIQINIPEWQTIATF